MINMEIHETQSEVLTHPISPSTTRRPIQKRMVLVSGYIAFTILFTFFALITFDGGRRNGGFGQIMKGITGNYFSGEHLVVIFIMLRLAVMGLIPILFALYLTNTRLTKNRLVKLVLIVLLGYAITRMTGLATNNLVLMFFTTTYVPAAYWYYLTYGELKSFMNNRVVIFSLRRSFAVIPLFFTISLGTFVGINTIGDPVAIALGRVEWGADIARDVLLNRYGLVDANGDTIPVMVRYFNWLDDFIHGDLGISYATIRSVNETIGERLWETLKMQILSLVIAVVLSVVIGMVAAYYHRSVIDSAVSSLALLGLSMPIFVSGLLAILIFGGIGLNLFPTAGAHGVRQILVVQYNCAECLLSPLEYWQANFAGNALSLSFWGTMIRVWWVYTWDGFLHLVLPVLTLAFATMAVYSRLTRSTMLEVMRQDYILAARANGLSERNILTRHAMRNVLLPLVTFIGINVGGLLAGAPITETVFSWPGLGTYFVQSLGTLDMNVLMALTMIITLMILFANLITDIVYTKLDPRIAL